MVVLMFLGGSAGPIPGAGVFDAASVSCTVSYDGAVWYRVPAGSFSPIDIRRERCAPSVLSRVPPPVPGWARPRGKTQAIFTATSLQETYTVEAIPTMERIAQEHHIPLTWMIGNIEFFTANAPLYKVYHATNGDDIQIARDAFLAWTVRSLFPWYERDVDIAGAGSKRAHFLPTMRERRSKSAFWGIAWNSNGIDQTRDYGAPWGTYCADPISYKRPDPSGACSFLAFEWTARDLTRAYLSGHEEYFSTDPDDLRRAGFTKRQAPTYVRALVDAYAAAGERAPLVFISQQESAEEDDDDDAILSALYDEAVKDRMRVMTLARAASIARSFSAAPRAVAFPFLPGGIDIPSPMLGYTTMYPATIDYHDSQIGMTFLGGHLLPTRLFRYRDYPKSSFGKPMSELPFRDTPVFEGASVGNGKIVLRFQAPVALRYGIALWSNPDRLGLSGRGVTIAGRAGAVVTFELREGNNEVVIPCGACASDVLPYAV